MNRRITGEIRALNDLLFRSSQRRGNVLESLPYIPGSALRGALGRRWIERHGMGEPFHRLFQSGRVRFCHGRATIDGNEAFPAPLTLRTEKLRPLAPDARTFDLLAADPDLDGPEVDRVRADVTLDGVVRARTSPNMVSRTRIGTFAPEDFGDTPQLGPDPAAQDGAQQGLAADGQLFTEIRLAASTTFLTHIEGPAQDLDQLAAILDDEDTLTLGRSRSVMGLSDVRWSSPVEIPAGQLHDGDEHTLTLLSDLVLLDRYQRHVTVLDNAALAQLLGTEVGEVDVVHPGQQRTAHVAGWDGPNGMSTHIDTALRAGSTVRFRAPRHAVERLAADPWAGWRRAEGHGRLAVDWPLHRDGGFRRQDSATDSSVAVQDTEELLAQAAQAIAAQLRKAPEPVTTRVWSQVQEAVRRDPEFPNTTTPMPEHTRPSESLAGRGTGHGQRRRETRRQIVDQLQSAFEGQLPLAGAADSGWARPLDRHEQLSLVEHIGRELRLEQQRRNRTEQQPRESNTSSQSEGAR